MQLQRTYKWQLLPAQPSSSDNNHLPQKQTRMPDVFDLPEEAVAVGFALAEHLLMLGLPLTATVLLLYRAVLCHSLLFLCAVPCTQHEHGHPAG